MSALSKHRILLTGLPGCGKTTLIKSVADKIIVPAYGFYTQEIRTAGRRAGFAIETFSTPPKKGVLSHIDIDSKYRVGKYGVDVDSFEKLAIPELEAGLDKQSLIIIDEIGKMELFSERFKNLLIQIFESERSFLATIMYKPHPLCDKLKKMEGVEVITVTKWNREELFKELYLNFS